MTLLQDFRYGLRILRKNPGFTSIAVLTLALGIGANTALFSVVNAVLLRPLPYRDPARLVQLWESNRGVSGVRVSRPNFLDWREQSRGFEHMSAYAGGPVTATGGDLPERTTGTAVSRDFFAIFGVSAVLGRTFLPEEHQPGRDVPAVIGYGLWQRAFGSAPTVIGKTLRLSGIPIHIVGVAPPGFKFPDDTELWIPSEAIPDDSSRSAHNYFVVGRLKAGVSIAQAQAEMAPIAHRLEQQYPDSNRGMGVSVISLRDQTVGHVQPPLLILLGSVGFVLLIACANVANLLLARSAARTREMAVRSAIGAGRIRLVRQLLTESVLLAALGGIAGLVLALWSTSLVASFVPSTLPRASEISVDSTVLWFTLGISVVTGLLFGLLPAMRISRTDLNESLKESAGRVATGQTRTGNILVVSELALSLVLLMAAGLLIQSFLRILQVDPGFRSEHVLTARLSLPIFSLNEEIKPGPVLNYYEQMLEKMRSIPGVVAVGTTTQMPLGSERDTNGIFDIEGRPPAGSNSSQDASYRVVSPDYFRAMSIPLLAGRAFSGQDSRNVAQVAIINEKMARRFWPGQDAIGKRIKFKGMEAKPEWMTVVGVTGDVREFGLTRGTSLEVFVPFAQHLNGWLADPNLIVRAAGDPNALISAVREALRGIDKNIPVEFAAMDALVAQSVSQQRFQMRLLGLFATLALALAAVGMYGVISYSVSRRTHEIGIRMALGARRHDVLRMIIRQGMTLTAMGVIIGVAAAAGLNRLLANLLYGVSSTDVTTFVIVSLVLSAVSLVAIWIPARRAIAVDPIIALRYE